MSKHTMYMNMAKEMATSSKCVSKHVACLLVKEGRIISSGINGTPKGYANCDTFWKGEWSPHHHEWSKKYEVHAEQNAIIWAARKGISIEGCIAYCTLMPCMQCTKMLVASGITKIFYDKIYEHTDEKELHDFVNSFFGEDGQLMTIERITSADSDS